MKRSALYLSALPLSLAMAACGAGAGSDEDLVSEDGVELEGQPPEVGKSSQAFLSLGAPNLLVIKSQPGAANPYTVPDTFWEGRFFGNAPDSMKSYFNTQSGNRFGLLRSNLVSVRDDLRDLDATAGITAAMQANAPAIALRRRAIIRASLTTDFRFFDDNQDRTLDPDEMPVLIIDQTGDGGAARDVGEQYWDGTYDAAGKKRMASAGCIAIPVPNQPSLQYCGMVAHAGENSSLMTMAHELAHTIFDAADLYGRWNTSDNYSQGFTLQQATLGEPRTGTTRVILDPYHRRRNNWIQMIVNGTPNAEGSARLQPAGAYKAGVPGHELVAIARNANEDLLVEYRRRDTPNDQSLGEEGLVFWSVRKGGTHGLAEVVSPEGGGSFQAAVRLGFVDCRANASRRESLGRGPIAQPNGTYRVNWGDGTDTGLLFTIGAVQGDKTVTIAWRPAATAPSCPVRSDYQVEWVNEPPPLSHSFGTLTISDTTRNIGTPQDKASTVTYYISKDRTFSADDVKVGQRTVPGLTRIGPVGDPGNNPLERSTGDYTFTVPWGIDTDEYYYIACANQPRTLTELVTANNCLASVNTVFIL